ncbi:hypothetical protein Acr_00g0080010 [Actinidia rufa]|uniref:Mitochondrial protein n=1 Tax=Actinidia rufa TaxID=165716 RepID=A0A7J0DTX3_9ERIC|nr:hypothetical protein Acr_00g0080010 [Actinidia rufa]
MQALRCLMAQNDSSPTIISTSTSSYFAYTGISANAFTASSSVPWIINSGASDHMTGKGSIRFSPSISLSSVHHILNFATNLLSELETGKVIGSGKAHGGLYFLEYAPHSPMSCGLALQADKGSALSMGSIDRRKRCFLVRGRNIYDHGEETSDRRKEKSGEEPISPERATRDIGGDEEASPHQLQKSNLKTYAHREKGKSSCVIPPCQLQSPTSVPDSPTDSSVTGDDVNEILNLKSRLAQEFEIKDLESLRYFLGMEVARPVNSPIEANHHLSGDMGERTNKERHQRLVGRLIYLAHTRPDVSYAVGVVSQFMHDPRTSHLNAVYRILRYLKSAPGKGIMFSNHGHLQLEVFTDAEWAGSVDDRCSTSAYCTFLDGNLVTWRRLGSKSFHPIVFKLGMIDIFTPT